MRIFLYFLVAMLFTSHFNPATSDADVLIENGGTSSFKAAFIPGVMELSVDSGAGQADDYILLTCGAFSNSSSNAFTAPDPAIFTQLDTENCGASNNCIEGIWGGFTSNAASESLTCNTTGTSIIFNATTLRYSNVDPMNPLISIACSEGNGLLATAPSIATEAGSQVVRIFTSFAFVEDESDSIMIDQQMASFDLETSLEGSHISTIGTSDLFNTTGATGTADQPYTGLTPRDWRACTIALRMLPIVQFTLDVTKSGDGDGTVTSMPAGIDCGVDCTNPYDVDTVVELTAVPDVNSVFVQWSGDCMGTDPTTTVTMDADRTCDAEFTVVLPPTPTPVPPTPTPTPTITPAPPTDSPTPTPTIIPPPDVTSVPTLGQWGHLSVGIFAVLIGVWFLRRHRVKT